MRKAMMYLLLALGICLVVAFAGGALVGFMAGFIDGFNESQPGTTSSTGIMTLGGLLLVLVLCAILHWVFLRFGFSSYSVGRIPRRQRWKVLPVLMAAMGGLALLICVMYNPLAPYDGTQLTESDDAVRNTYLWMKTHPLRALLGMAAIEATASMILYGAVLREILEWKHNPNIVVNVFAAVMSLFALFSNPILILPSFMTFLLEGWTYEYSRSIIPVILGDIFYWIVMLCLLGISFPSWWFLIAAILILPGFFLTLKLMEPYKPID